MKKGNLSASRISAFMTSLSDILGWFNNFYFHQCVLDLLLKCWESKIVSFLYMSVHVIYSYLYFNYFSSLLKKKNYTKINNVFLISHLSKNLSVCFHIYIFWVFLTASLCTDWTLFSLFPYLSVKAVKIKILLSERCLFERFLSSIVNVSSILSC